MIYELKGDLLASDCNIIIHCCNCFNTMGAGIAKAISTKWPEAKAADNETIRGDKDKLGTFTFAEAADGTKIFNLYGQYNYGSRYGKRNLDYDALKLGLEKIKEFLESNYHPAFYKVGTYKLGCYRAGGDWKIVKAIIEDVFPDWNIYVYEL